MTRIFEAIKGGTRLKVTIEEIEEEDGAELAAVDSFAQVMADAGFLVMDITDARGIDRPEGHA